jgi:MoxR-like ATPase
LLEAMDERRVSLDGQTHVLEDPFFVVATQNPEEFHGTYPLPESQLDRFLMRIHIGYPPEDVEREVIRQRRWGDPTENLRVVADMAALIAAQETVDRVRIADDVIDFVHALVLATRRSPLLQVGASTRAAIALERAVRAFALVQGRAYATPDDVKALAVVTLAHRVRPRGAYDGTVASADTERIIQELVGTLPVPV